MSVTRVNPPSVHNPSDQITQVVTVDGRQLVHLSGQVAWDEQGQPVGLGDHGAQAAQIARNLAAALAAVGATRDDIVDETVYVVDYTPELLPAIFGPLRAGVAKAPASTLVGVSALFAPAFLLEVKVVAALPGPGSQDRAVPADADTEAGTSARAHERDEDQDLETDGTQPPGLESPVLRRATGTRAFGGPGVDGGAGGPGGQGAGWQYCGAVGKQANCQVTVSVQAATDTASCPLQWALFVPEEWDQDPGGRRAAGVPDEVRHVPKPRLALVLLDQLSGSAERVPVIVADAGYGRSVGFRQALEERGLSYVVAVEAKEAVQPGAAEPYRPPYGGLGPPTRSCYREPHQTLADSVEASARFDEVTWRQGSKGRMTSCFAVLPVRPTGKLARATAQEQAGGRARWNGVLPLRTLLVEQPDDAGEPTGFWMSNLPASTPIADLVRFAKMRRRIEHDYANSNTAWAWTTSRPAPGAAGTTTSPSSPPPRPSSPSGGFTQKHRFQPEPLPSPRHSAGHAAVLDRHLHHLRPTTHQSQNLTKHY